MGTSNNRHIGGMRMLQLSMKLFVAYTINAFLELNLIV